MKNKIQPFLQTILLHQWILLFSLIVFFSSRSSAQIWNVQNSGTFNNVLGIDFVDNNTGYAVGGGGTILKTTNGGAIWNAQVSGQSNDFYAVDFTDAQHGVAVGDFQAVRTTDGGATWTQAAVPTLGSFRAVWFMSTQVGFILGSVPGIVLKTTDAGATWTDISPGGFTGFYSVFFTDVNTGYISDYDGFILKTLDGGLTWSANQVSNNHLFGLFFTDANHGYCVGGDPNANTSVILKTNDAGTTWTATNNPDPTANYLLDVEFIDANTGYAIGGNVQNNTGTILKTTNAGLTWIKQTTNPSITSRLYRLSLPSASIGYGCGLDGTILKLGNTTNPPEDACDVKVNGCMKYEILTITEDAGKNRTYRIRVTNNCSNKLCYFAVQVPDGIQAIDPLNNTIFTSEGGRAYAVRSPNFSPFYSVRYSPTTDSIVNGQSDIFEYTLPAQADPTYIHVTVRLATQVYYEAHLNTFYCPIGQTLNGTKPKTYDKSVVPSAGTLSCTISPNPNAGAFELNLSEVVESGTMLRITDYAGRLVLEQQTEAGNKHQTVQAGDLPAGLYFLQVVSDGKVLAVEKFVKQ